MANKVQITFKRLKRGIVKELCLLDDMKVILDSVVARSGGFAPVKKVIVVYHTTAKVSLYKESE